jgi:hypothetical protein
VKLYAVVTDLRAADDGAAVLNLRAAARLTRMGWGDLGPLDPWWVAQISSHIPIQWKRICAIRSRSIDRRSGSLVGRPFRSRALIGDRVEAERSALFKTLAVGSRSKDLRSVPIQGN